MWVNKLEPYLSRLYPLLEYFNLPPWPEVAILMALTIALAVITLFLFLTLPSRNKRKAVKADSDASKTPDKATIKLGIASRLEVVNSQNARLIAERDELYRALGKMFDERQPLNHQEAMAFIEEHRAIFAMMIDALQEGSAQWQTKAKGDASILHYLFDLTDAAVRSNNIYVRSQRDFGIISAYAKHSREHSALMSEELQTVITPPNPNALAISKSGALTRA